MKIAVTGYRGRLGSELLRRGGISIRSDIRNFNGLRDEIISINPDVVINCASNTQVDRFEESKFYVENMTTNLDGVSNLCVVAEEQNIKLIHISTDYIFNGNKGAYKENKQIGETPINAYGWCKLASEVIVSISYQGSDNFLVVRTTGLYSEKKQNDFFDLVLTSLEAGKTLKVTTELHGNQTYIPHLIDALIYVSENQEIIRKHGVLHLGSEEVMSRYDFALMIANVFGYNKDLLIPVKNKDITGWIAKRPKKAGLDTSLARKIGVPIYTVLDGLKECKENLQ